MTLPATTGTALVLQDLDAVRSKLLGQGYVAVPAADMVAQLRQVNSAMNIMNTKGPLVDVLSDKKPVGETYVRYRDDGSYETVCCISHGRAKPVSMIRGFVTDRETLGGQLKMGRVDLMRMSVSEFLTDTPSSHSTSISIKMTGGNLLALFGAAARTLLRRGVDAVAARVPFLKSRKEKLLTHDKH